MWALLSTRLRTWLLFAIAVPLAGAVARAIARRIERRNHGSTRLSRALYRVGDLASRGDRRPKSTSLPDRPSRHTLLTRRDPK